MAARSSRTQWPTVMNPTASEIEKSSPTSQHDDDDSEPTFALLRKSRLSAPRLQAQLYQLFDRSRLRRLKNTLLIKGAWQQVTRIEDLCHTHVSNTWLNHIDACAGSVLTPHDYITNLQRRLGNKAYTGFGQCRLCGSFLDSQLEHGESCSTAEATRGHYACVHAVLGGLKLADQESPRNPRGLTEAQSRLADLFTTGAVPGRSAALDVCVASSNAAAARGDAAQAAFDRKISQCRRRIPVLFVRGSFTAPWCRQQTVAPSSLQYAADIAACRDGHQMSAKALQHRWKHEIQRALLRRRAAMTRAVLPKPQTQPEWLLAGLKDRALSHWVRAPPLDGR